MSDGLFSIGISGLRAAQLGLATTGHNITNATTTGYNRQEIVQSTNIALPTGSGFIGQGTNVSTIKRIYSELLDKQVQTAQSKSSYLDTYYSQISQIDNMLADTTAGLSPALQDFFSSVQDVAANPADVASRQSMLSSSSELVTRFQTLSQRLNEIGDGVNSQITSEVSLINSYAQQIGDINRSIALAQGSTNQPPNDLLDQRDKLISDLNKEVNVSVVKQDDGSYNVFMGQGQALVVGQSVSKLIATASAEDPSQMVVAYDNNGSTQILPDSSLDGGNLGGLLAFRSQTLIPAQNELGRVAIGLAQTFNDQHRLGQDLNGDPGGYYFNVRGPAGISGQFAVPSAKVISNANNAATSGVPAVTLTDVNALKGSDYKLALTGGGYTLTRLSDNTTVFSNAALPQTVDGLTITAPATAAVNDTWLIEPTRDGAVDIGVAITDTAKIAAAAPIRTGATTSNTGSGTISAGVVDANFLAAPLAGTVTLTYNSATNTFSGFPATAPVTVTQSNGTSTTYAAGTPVPFTAGATITFNGISVSIAGTPANGDTFTITGPNSGGVSDNRNALLLAGLQTKNTLSGGTATYQSVYSQLVSSIGVKSNDINVSSQAQATLLTQTQQTQQSVSGVNLDEEAANLLRYQQAYQASGKMMQIASTLFDTLLSLGQ